MAQSSNPHDDLARHYANLSQEKQQQIQIIALNRKDQIELTDKIRTALKESGVLSIQSKSVQTLSTQTLSDAQKKHVQFYEIGDQITLNPYARGQTNHRIIAKENQMIHIVDAQGKQQTIALSAHNLFQVTKTKALELSVGDRLLTEKNILIVRAKIDKGSQFIVHALQQDGAYLNYNNKKLYFSNQELADLSLDHDYVKRPNQVASKSELALIAFNNQQANKNSLAELAEVAPKIKWFTQDINKSQQQCDKAQITWTITDIAESEPSLIYRDKAYADAVIRKDLNILASAIDTNNPDHIAELALSYALAKLGEREAAFKHQDLLTKAMQYVLGKTTVNDIEKIITEKSNNGELIHSGTYWTTKEVLQLEQKIIQNNLGEQGKVDPIFKPEQLSSLPEKLTLGQKNAISLALTTVDRFVSVQGLAGVGKTTMMQELQNLAQQKNFKLIGLAPTHQAKLELSHNGIESMTIDRFLINENKYSEKTLFIIDEASMIGNQHYAAIQQRVIDSNARAIFTGDVTQLQSIASGIPHELTISTKTQKVAFMQDILRQNPNSDLKQAVIHASKQEISQSIERLEKINPENYIKREADSKPYPTTSIIEINNKPEIYQAMAQDFLTRIPKYQQQTLVIAHTHEDRREINALIRNELKQQGIVAQENIVCQRLVSKNLEKADLLQAKNYTPGDVLRFGRDFAVAKKEDYFTVFACDAEKNLLNCSSSTCNKFTIDPAKIAIKSKMSVYQAESCQLAVGDRIKLRLTNEQRGHIANTEYTISKIDQNKAWLINDKNSLEIKLNEKHDSHWDYAYTNTAYGVQGATSKFVIALELSTRTQATNHRSHEIDISRASTQATIYTDNKQALVKRLSNRAQQLAVNKKSAYQLHTTKANEKTTNTPKIPRSNNKTDYAKKLVEKSLPIKGTLAEFYLKNYRKVNNFENADLRFLPKISTLHGSKTTHVPALLAIARNESGEVNHVQVICLDPMTGDKDEKSNIIKQTYGSIKGCVIDLNKSSTSKVTYLTEGIETGLSILEHDHQAKVLAVLGKSNFKNVALDQLNNKVVMCLDNDDKNMKNDPLIQDAIKRLIDAKKDVSIVMLQKTGYDFNDVLRKECLLALQNQISNQRHTILSENISPVDATIFKPNNIKILERDF